MIVTDIAKGIYNDDGTDLQFTNLQHIASDAGFHAEIHSSEFADSCSGTCPEISVLIIVEIGILTGLIPHCLIRTAVRISYSQVKNIRLTDKRYSGHTDIKTNPFFFQKLHDSTGCIQTESTASAKKYGMDFLGTGKRLEKFTLS